MCRCHARTSDIPAATPKIMAAGARSDVETPWYYYWSSPTAAPVAIAACGPLEATEEQLQRLPMGATSHDLDGDSEPELILATACNYNSVGRMYWTVQVIDLRERSASAYYPYDIYPEEHRETPQGFLTSRDGEDVWVNAANQFLTRENEEAPCDLTEIKFHHPDGTAGGANLVTRQHRTYRQSELIPTTPPIIWSVPERTRCSGLKAPGHISCPHEGEHAHFPHKSCAHKVCPHHDEPPW